MSWVRRMFGRRRPDLVCPPAAPDPARMERARRASDQAGEVLDRVIADHQRVEETAKRAEDLRRQNHLGPSFWAWAESLQDKQRGERTTP